MIVLAAIKSKSYYSLPDPLLPYDRGGGGGEGGGGGGGGGGRGGERLRKCREGNVTCDMTPLPQKLRLSDSVSRPLGSWTGNFRGEWKVILNGTDR